MQNIIILKEASAGDYIYEINGVKFLVAYNGCEKAWEIITRFEGQRDNGGLIMMKRTKKECLSFLSNVPTSYEELYRMW